MAELAIPSSSVALFPQYLAQTAAVLKVKLFATYLKTTTYNIFKVMVGFLLLIKHSIYSGSLITYKNPL